MGHFVDTPLRQEKKSEAAPSPKPSIFISNLLKQRAITEDMAQVLHQLPNPPLQFQAMMRFRQHPEKSLETIVQEMLARPSELPRAWQEKRSDRRKINGVNWTRVGLTALLAGALLWIYFFWGSIAIWWSSSHLFQSASVPSVIVQSPMPQAPAPPPILTPTPQAAPTPIPTPAPAPSSHLKPELSRANAPVVLSPRVPQIAHLTAQWEPHGMVHLSWEPGNSSGQYRLYSSTSEDFSGPRLLEQDSIPMTWWDWMPPEGPSTVWLAVSQILPSGKETSISQPVEIHVP